MDFLLLFSAHERIVLEVDGQQHYSENNMVKPSLYAEMVAEDRRLRLLGYERGKSCRVVCSVVGNYSLHYIVYCTTILTP